MKEHEFTVGYLKAVERHNKEYFKNAGFTIMDCVIIVGEDPVAVHIVNKDLPAEIRHDIETMFWVS
ncbi:hypothetical protein KXD93_15515 [Mucilaginibacter sp. BJC16-A38]|uniref:hypothetical protein n=1 Tax=Mucilaginibacter phenanthrenivorans TaxID=1234842 RepID=UPI00215749CB|nr:hypothetical protein [Mucilaginibacter phenanthrenivorans]MCR8559064.1 hypothetical protein [Mucilaginibacter phenanthrenivorans]